MIVGDGANLDVVNVAGWAAGDGVRDDTAIIARLVADAGPGASLYFGGAMKTYRISGVSPLAGQRLCGQATLRLTDGSTSRLLDINGVTGVTVDGLTLDAAGVDVDALRVTHAQRTRLRNLTVKGATGPDRSGINVTTSAVDTVVNGCEVSGCYWGILGNGGATRLRITDCTITGCTATSVSQGALYLPNCTRVRVTDTVSSGNATHGVYLSTAASNVTFTGCDFDDNGTGTTDHRGASINGAARVTFTGCHATENQECGYFVTPTSRDISFIGCHAIGNNRANRPGGHGFEINGRGCTLTGCVSSAQGGAAANQGNGFSINGTGVALSACVSHDNHASGFRITGAAQVNVAGCHAYNNSQRGVGYHDGIEISVGAQNVTVTGSQCWDDQAVKTQRYGLAVSGTVDWYTLTDNVLRGNASGSLSDTGQANRTVSGNLT